MIIGWVSKPEFFFLNLQQPEQLLVPLEWTLGYQLLWYDHNN